MPRMPLRGMIPGEPITVVFTASNVCLGLKAGLTFASPIPAAVISMAVLKFFNGSNILEKYRGQANLRRLLNKNLHVEDDTLKLRNKI